MSDLANPGGAYSFEGETAVRSPRFFDPRLVCDHAAARAVVENVVHYHEDIATEGRIRKRRAKDKASALVANVACALVDGKGPPTIAIQLARPKAALTRYDARHLGQLPAVLEILSGDGGLITLRKSRRKGIASTIEPSASLMGLMAPFKNFGLKDFHWEPGEVIQLSHVTRDPVANTRATALVDYADDADTIRMRAELDAINEALGNAKLDFVDDGGPPVAIRKTNLRRIFNTPAPDQRRFVLGGRPYGGFWQTLARTRRHNIRIDRERVADLDFSAMFLRLAYCRAGIAPPAGDLYAGIIPDDPQGRWREGLKQVVNALLFRDKPLTRLPKGSADLLPPGMNGKDIRAAVLQRHPAVARVFESGAGLSLMKTESDLMMAILLRLNAARIVALPMHDGLMVHRDLAEVAAGVMADESERMTGFRLPIKTQHL